MTRLLAFPPANSGLVLVTILASLVLAGCQSGALSGAASPGESTARVESGEPREYARASDADKPEGAYFYDYETIYDLLVGEISARRGDIDTTLNYYVRQAHFTQNPEIIHRAILYAEYLNKDDTVLDLALLWTELEPENIFANQIAANQLFKHLRFEEAARHIDRLIANNRSPDLENILTTARLMDADGKREILNTIRSLTARHPEQPSLWYTQAILEVENSNIPRAVEAIDKVIALDEENLQAKLIKARTLMSAGSPEAVSYLKKVVRKHPKEKVTRLLYAMALEESGKLDESLKQYKKLVKLHPEDNDLHYSLAVVASASGEFELAKTEFIRLVEINYARTQSLMSLAAIAEQQHNYPEAIAWYERVNTPGEYLDAQISIANIHAKTGELREASDLLARLRDLHPKSRSRLYSAEAQLLIQYDELDYAYALLNIALSEFPDNANLLYARAMLGDKMDRLDILENDLLAILAKHPDNPMALNALGYTLADKTERYEEAYKYISKAYSLQPNDPAVVDSMGWVEYRLGNTSAAREHLKHAFELSGDHEIAAHYGEVLWVTGDRKGAMKVWEEALDKTPHSKPLNKVLERYLPLRKR